MNRDVTVTFPKKTLNKYHKYLKQVKVDAVEKTSIKQKEKILLQIQKDFLNGKISMDDFSAVCNTLWSDLEGVEKASSDLANALYAGAELVYYQRVTGKNEMLLPFLNEALGYKKK